MGSSLAGERTSTIFAMVIARAWRDESYREHLLTHPKEALAEEGWELPEGTNVEILADTPAVRHLSLPPEAADSLSTAGLIESALPLRPGRELRVVQSTDTTLYLALPVPPTGVDLANTPEIELGRRAREESVTSTVTFQTASLATTVSGAAEAIVVIVLS
ncbi:NHLP leader peptide family RiPP precursor [Streptomyces griseorubiginosus]|uniref:NHLP leader peptide family RiPP precursor n=1 Tax=Streptomyces griseorubiginosus TaxID=67304 RepID=UPI0033A687A2